MWITEDDETLLHCCSCKSLLRDPMLLQCLHNVCRKCLDRVCCTRNGSTSLVCPACNYETSMGVERENLFVAGQVGDFEKLKNVMRCGLCIQSGKTNESVDAWCSKCQMSMCDQHSLDHYLHLRDHWPTSLSEVCSMNDLIGTSVHKCRHHGETYDHLCWACKIPACVVCAKECLRNGHDVGVLDTQKTWDHFERIKENICQIQTSLGSKIDTMQNWKNVDSELDAAEANHMKELQANKRAAAESLERAYKAGEAALKEHYSKLHEKALELKHHIELMDVRAGHASKYSRHLMASDDKIGLLDQEVALLSGLQSLMEELDKIRAPQDAMRFVTILRAVPEDLDRHMSASIGMPRLLTDDLCCRDEVITKLAMDLKIRLELGGPSSIAPVVKQPEEYPLVGRIQEVDWAATVQPLKLNPSAMQSLRSLQKDLGCFSYYIRDDTGVVIHTEDGNAKRNCDMIRTAVDQIVKGCNEGAIFEVIVSHRSFGAFFCGNKIGAKVDVSERPQTIGMYLKDKSLLYGVTVAHNLVRDDRWNSDQFHHYEESSHHDPRMFDGDRPAIFDNRQSRPAFAACFSNKATSTRGRPMGHFIDIMLGPALLPAVQEETGEPTFHSTVNYLWSRCPTCLADRCTEPQHLRATNQYSMCTTQHFDAPVVGCDSEYYLLKEPYYMNLVCRPNNRDALAGVVVSHLTNVMVRFSEDHGMVCAENILLIKPCGSETPREGDSGSIWADQRSKEVIAITIGLGSMLAATGHPTDVWLATLLYPCFDVFEKVYGAKLENAEVFLPLYTPTLASSVMEA